MSDLADFSSAAAATRLRRCCVTSASHIRHLGRAHGAHGDVVDVARIGLAVILDVDVGAVLHVLLRDVEHVAVGIVGGDAGERARLGWL